MSVILNNNVSDVLDALQYRLSQRGFQRHMKYDQYLKNRQ